MITHRYIGRFAPSPSGPLHLGSLTCALASYFDAKANRGIWLVRIEDIDPPREQVGAAASILSSLAAHGLYHDGPVTYQSQRTRAYTDAIKRLEELKLSYRCSCTRKRLAQLPNGYDRLCLKRPPLKGEPSAIRLNIDAVQPFTENEIYAQDDLIQGPQSDQQGMRGDFIIKRKDGLFAYQLAVSVDDLAQNITHVVRGCDLLETTPQQIQLISALGGEAPRYAHIPVIVTEPGKKLSKQNYAPAIDDRCAAANIVNACRALGLVDAPNTDHVPTLLNWGTANWKPSRLEKKREVMLSSVI